MEVNGIDSLLEELLEEVLLRLPYVALLNAKRVCRKWKQIMESDSFRRLYRSTAKLVAWRSFAELFFSHELIDSNGIRLRSAISNLVFRGLTSQGTSVMAAIDGDSLYFGNIFSNKWEKISELKDMPEDWEIGIFGSGPDIQDHKIVLWSDPRRIMTLVKGESQRLEWSTVIDAVIEPREDLYLTDAYAVINNSMFRVEIHDADPLLVEYNVLDNRLSSVPIASNDRNTLVLDNSSLDLVVWKEDLYLVTMSDDDEVIRIWKMSTSDGRATLVNRFETGDVKMLGISYVGLEDDEHIYIQGQAVDGHGMAVSLVYSMEKHSIRDITSDRWLCLPRTLPVKL